MYFFFPELLLLLLIIKVLLLFAAQSQPLFELRCSNNVVHLHTCADSCATLVNLLQYLVSQGDLHPPPRHNSPTEIAGQKLPVRVMCSLQILSYSIYYIIDGV